MTTRSGCGRSRDQGKPFRAPCREAALAAGNGVLTTGWLYQDQLTPIAELDGSGNLTARFVYATGINVPDYVVKGDSTYRLIRDHLGSVRLVVNVQSGTVAQRVDYDEFGVETQNTSPGFQPFGYAGGLTEAATGLVRFGARDYQPEAGRWTAKDPIGFLANQGNLYEYTGGDPINGLDPTGKFAPILINVGIGLVSGAFNAWNYHRSHPDAKWGPVAKAFAVGAVTGFTASLFGPAGMFEAGLLGYFTAMGTDALTQKVTNPEQDICWQQAGRSAIYGFFGGAAGAGIGKLLGSAGRGMGALGQSAAKEIDNLLGSPFEGLVAAAAEYVSTDPPRPSPFLPYAPYDPDYDYGPN